MVLWKHAMYFSPNTVDLSSELFHLKVDDVTCKD